MKNRLDDGSDLDVEQYVRHYIDLATGEATEPRIFRDLLPTSRDVTTAVLLDGSSSLGVHGGRIFKLELACADALSKAMTLARERHGIFVFTGNTRHRVEVSCLKDFEDRRFVPPGRLGLATGGYTRLGAPLRHLTSRLLAQPSERRLLIVIGDGLISDEGYEGRYAWADVAHAVEEANDAGVSIYYVGVGPTRVDPLPEVFGPRRSQRIRRVEELPRVLAHVHRELVTHDREPRNMTTDIYYSNGNEVQLFEQAYQQRLPVMLTGPTGCGKTRLVEHMGLLLSRPVVTISCHDDLTSSDLVGRFMVTGGDVVWTDGPLTRAVKAGAICYLDEVVEARHDSLAILHSLTDHRRALYLDRADEVVTAPETFMLVCSYNPAYRSSLKELKPSFRQRFVTLPMRYLPADHEAEVIVAEAGIELSDGGKAGCLRQRHQDGGSRLPLRAAVHPRPGHRRTADRRRRNRIGGSRSMHPRASVDRRCHQRRLARGRRRQPCHRRQLDHASLEEQGKEPTTMDQKERQRKKALIILQIVIYGYLLVMFGVQLYMSFARGWWNCESSATEPDAPMTR